MKTSNIKRKLIAIAMASVMAGSTMTGMAVTASTVNYETVSADSSISETGAIVSEGTTSDGWKYCIEDKGTASIVKYTGNAKKVTLPISIEGKSIHYIVEGALKGTSVETLVIPDGTPLPVECSEKQLTWNAFADSPNLKEVVIGSMFAEAVPEYSFQGCSKLEKVTFTKDFSKKAIEAGSCAIRTEAFDGTAIKSFVVPEGITEIRRKALASTCVENISIPTTIISKMESTENFSNDVDINTITGYNKGIKKIIVKGDSTLALNYSYDTVVLYCSKNSMMKKICDAYDVVYTDISTINVEKVECGWLGIPYEPATTPTTTTTTTATTTTVPTSTTETKPTETTTTIVEPTTVSTTTNIAKKTTVKLSSYSKNVYVKGKTIINPIVRNGKGKTTYRSNNTKIAKVNSKGIVTALKSGTAKITVTNNKVSKVFTIKVLNPKLNKTSVSIKRGKSFTLKISGKIGTAKFYTSNKKIAKVNKYGKIKVNKKAPKGKTAYITVKTNGVTLKCKVKVK